MRGVVGLVEEAAVGDNQVADVLVLRDDAQHQRVLLDAAGKADAVVHLQHRRGVHDAGHLLVHGLFVVAGQVVVVARALRRCCAAARIFQLHLVGADLLQQLENVLLAREADGHDQDHRRRADDHAQSGEREARLAGAEAVHGQLQNLAHHHGLARAQQRLLKRGASRLLPGLFADRIHRFLLNKMRWRALGVPNSQRNAGRTPIRRPS